MAAPVDLHLALGINFARHFQETLMPLLRPAIALSAALACSAFFAFSAAVAEPSPPQGSAFADIVDFGIYCRPAVTGTQPAPDTTLGYVNVLGGETIIRYRQQQVPATLGISFGVIAQPRRTVLSARMETYRPGRTTPDIWYSDLYEASPSARGFTFEFENELMLGSWRMEAWDGDTQLYSVEFEVVPPAEQPGIGADCNMLS